MVGGRTNLSYLPKYFRKEKGERGKGKGERGKEGFSFPY
jgi:hypothetical protein